ncbi:hypothetical protein ACFL00_04180 [Pseudomonadota bacterium]
MDNSFRLLILPLLLAFFLLTGCDSPEPATSDPASEQITGPTGPRLGVDSARIIAADQEPGNWLSHGRSYDEQRFSPLNGINDSNVAELGLE